MINNASLYTAFLLIAIVGLSPRSMANQNASVSLEDATQQVQQSSQGKILSVKTTHNHNGTSTHRIKVLTSSGQVKVYNFPSDYSSNSAAHNNYRNQGNSRNHGNRNNSYRNNHNSKSSNRHNPNSNNRHNSNLNNRRNMNSTNRHNSNNHNSKRENNHK